MKIRVARAFDSDASRRSRSGPLHYRDQALNSDAIKLLPAEYFASEHEIAMVTVLGSCVAACLRDPVLKIGGMNHFMLPDGDASTGEPARYGSHAMELLINTLLKMGASRERLEAKVFGGGNVLKSFTTNQVGTRNAAFALDYLKAEHIRIVAQDLGGIHPRKVGFFPVSGRAMVKHLPHAHDAEVVAEESRYYQTLRKAPETGTVELF